MKSKRMMDNNKREYLLNKWKQIRQGASAKKTNENKTNTKRVMQ